MASLTKIVLSGATYGAPIPVAGTTITSPTTIHTSINTTTAGLGDEVVLYCANVDTVSHTLTLGIGGTVTANLAYFIVAANTTAQVLPGHLLLNAQILYAVCDVTNKMNVFGYCIRSS